ncbi:hypothetical protein BBD42_11030 [Paenibacillus sp. BIHB 4019]|uniref:Uncharacterized protein n=1 Tax=Paenibacillus sp. BIHB 4019 TaxID=1870819 RepID=A0A1B2DGW1_9BACL|nr:DUF5693 family protein [Paenibacillus sp. BIHB 4019]ANY66943.1 hypothetical protein BBD42_11030 [Paenibacillus sp. BIHB 4019]
MLQNWLQWNRRAKQWLWIITLIGVMAALPIGYNRMNTESTSKQVEYVFDYRDLIEIAEYSAKPQDFISQHLIFMKEAGISTMAVYESSLRELMQAGRLTYYNSKEAALLQGKLETPGQNFTYILYSGSAEKEQIGPIVRAAFDRAGIVYRDWSFDGRDGLVVELPLQNSLLQPLGFDPMSLERIQAAGFRVLPRLTDRVLPYSQEEAEATLAQLKNYGVTRILFDGDKVKGYTDNAEEKSLRAFAELLNKYQIGVTTIENLKKEQSGMTTLAYLTDYNIVRLYSLSPTDAMRMKPEDIADRFLLAAKDRNIRMFFLNGAPASSQDKSAVINPLDNLYLSLKGEDGNKGTIQRLADAGFAPGTAEPFDREYPSWVKMLKGIVVIGAIALIALLINAFLPGTLIAVFLLGIAGSAGLYVLSSSVLEQALALGAGISAPTLALIWVMNRIYSRTEGNQRFVGGADWTFRSKEKGQGVVIPLSSSGDAGSKWVFEGLPARRRLGLAFSWFIVVALMSLIAVPYVFGLLNNITYMLVLQQFRGVSLLHLAPIALVAIYVVFYTGHAPIARIRKMLSTPINVLMVVVGLIVVAAGMYYLSRTGNEGQTLPFERPFREWLEGTFGVRPRNKEFLLAHPLLLVGLFAALRYRAAWLFVIIGSIGQLSMVDTFAHIHTPLHISIIRVFLGLGLGAAVGFILIGVWQLLEGVWSKWSPALKRIFAE